MFHETKRRALLRRRCRPLAADDLAEVIRAVERLERSVVAERRVIRPGCHDMTRIVLRGDFLLRTFAYCGTTPPAEVVRFVEEISEPLGRRFGKELAAGLAATAPWASPVPLDPPAGLSPSRGRFGHRLPTVEPLRNLTVAASRLAFGMR